jgi:hypothetical protein
MIETNVMTCVTPDNELVVIVFGLGVDIARMRAIILISNTEIKSRRLKWGSGSIYIPGLPEIRSFGYAVFAINQKMLEAEKCKFILGDISDSKITKTIYYSQDINIFSRRGY